MNERKIFVYLDHQENSTVPMGVLYASSVRGVRQFSFEYDPRWLQSNAGRTALDPDLSLYEGRQYPLHNSLFGIFSDSCPDRWGRLLLKRKEALAARQENRKPAALDDLDYLLGVSDKTRMGALRFKTEADGPFLGDDRDMPVPPWVSLRDLEYASYAFEHDMDIESGKWLRQLLAPGSSLGGARPKASVSDKNGELWIAKFPSRHDDYDSGAWEKTVHDLARACCIRVPEAKQEVFSKGTTFLVKRFDRDGSRRIHFASAMTLLGKTDGASASDGTGYPDLADFIRSNGSAPAEDLEELWKRIVLNMLVSNTDDHLRNHGFLLGENGWRLSPAYDINPVPEGETLSLNVDGLDNTISLDLAITSAPLYGLTRDKAAKIAERMREVVRIQWKKTAERSHIKRSEIEKMAPAFDEAEIE